MQVDGVRADVTAALDRDIREMAGMLESIAERRRPWLLAVAERVKDAVRAVFPANGGGQASVFGSTASGLAAPCSDLDMVVRNFSPASDAR